MGSDLRKSQWLVFLCLTDLFLIIEVLFRSAFRFIWRGGNYFSCHLPIQAVPGKSVGRAPPPTVIVQDIEVKSNLLLFTR